LTSRQSIRGCVSLNRHTLSADQDRSSQDHTKDPDARDHLPWFSCTNHLSSFLERFGVDLDQNHGEVLVRGAALMRGAARHDDQIAFLDFKSFAIDDTRTAPLAGISFFWRIELATEY